MSKNFVCNNSDLKIYQKATELLKKNKDFIGGWWLMKCEKCGSQCLGTFTFKGLRMCPDCFRRETKITIEE